MVRLQSLCKSFGSHTVLDDLSLEIEAGERFLLLGGSGCGKTTLLRLIAGFETPDAGSIQIDGKDILPDPVEQRPVGFIFQNYALFPHMSVYDNIAVGPRVRGVAETDLARRIDELLEITQLTRLRAASPTRLSGGEAQRVAIARALINQPKILLLDEPLSALDATLRQTLREELRTIQQTLGITFLFVTHDQEEAMNLATRMGILEAGRLLQTGTPETLYHRPASAFVAGFLGSINRLSGVVQNKNGNGVTVALGGRETLRCAGETPVAVGEPVSCFIRPERMFLLEEAAGNEPVNRLDAVFLDKTFFGHQTRLHLELAGGQNVSLLLGPGTGPALQARQPVHVFVSGQDILLFEGASAPERSPDAPPA